MAFPANPTWLLVVMLGVFPAGPTCDAVRIIMTSPQFRSHIMMQLAVGEELVKRGHEVYVALGSQYAKPEAITSSTGIRVLTFDVPEDRIYPASVKAERMLTEFVLGSELGNRADEESTFSAVLYDGCDSMLSDKDFMHQVRSLKFDLAIIEAFFLCPCSVLLPHAIDIPYVSLSGMYIPWLIKQPALPSLLGIPGPRGTTNHDLSTLFGRLSSLVRYVAVQHVVSATLWSNVTLLEKYSPSALSGNGVPTWYELTSKSLLFLSVADHHLDDPVSSLPNFITIPGLSVRPAQPLPADSELERFFSESSSVILANFGSTAYYIPAALLNKFFDAFSRLDEGVVVRFFIPDGVSVPKNVHVTSWLPQNDILGNPKTKLFLTHCGLNGMHESIYHGVPFLGLPLFGEQHWNCELASRRGYGIDMDIAQLTADQLYSNIRRVIDNSSYADASKKASAILRDEEPMIGRVKAAFWIEHVIKFGGEHLRSPAADMPLYQILMLDLLAVLVLSLFLSCSFVYIITVRLVRFFNSLLNSKVKQKVA